LEEKGKTLTGGKVKPGGQTPGGAGCRGLRGDSRVLQKRGGWGGCIYQKERGKLKIKSGRETSKGQGMFGRKKGAKVLFFGGGGSSRRHGKQTMPEKKRGGGN